jgi:hypothetical protein
MTDDDFRDLRTESFWTARYWNQLINASDCRDPAHPGCERCNPTHEDENEKEEETA